LSPGHRIDAGIDQRHLPRNRSLVVMKNGIADQIDSDIGAMQHEVGEVFLDDIALIA
jgi:uncharacterized protein YqkB